MRLHELIAELGVKGKCGPDLKAIYEGVKDVEIEVPDEEVINKAVQMLSATANNVRLSILALIRDVPLPVCAISKILGIEQTLVSHHLRALKEAGLVEVQVRGRYRIYSISREGVRELFSMLEDLIGHHGK